MWLYGCHYPLSPQDITGDPEVDDDWTTVFHVFNLVMCRFNVDSFITPVAPDMSVLGPQASDGRAEDTVEPAAE